jgi:hypothetical protein
MLLLKACPHCHGDLVFEQDRDCGYFTCVQCGHILSTAQERALGYRVTALGALHAPAGARPARPPAQRPRRARRSSVRSRRCARASGRRASLRPVKASAS